MSNQPNIILINCDDLGYGDLGCYGSQVNKTPVIDKLATEGMRFTDFYMLSPVCSPSRAAMLTGCYPPRIGFGTFEDRPVLFPGQPLGLNPEEITIAKLLKQDGYHTKLIGKWHCGDQLEFLPTQHGFDSYYGLPYSNDMGIQYETDTYPPLPLLRDNEVIQAQPDQTSLTERYIEEAVRFIRDTQRDHQERPFFLYFAHMYVHLPLYVPDRFLRESENGRYGAAVECIDWATGVILHELKTQGLDDNTIIIFTSDNGSRARNEGGSNHPLRATKGTTWEGGQRVPCLMRWPGKIPAGEVCQELTTAMDFYPTLAALAGLETPQDRIIDGQDIRPLIFGVKGATSSYDAFFYYLMNNLEAVRCGKWKLHVGKQGEVIKELYDLEADIGETQNVYDQHPEIVAELRAKMDACRQDIGDAATGVEGQNTRPVGRVENPDTLTHFDREHPYIIAMYDLQDRG